MVDIGFKHGVHDCGGGDDDDGGGQSRNISEDLAVVLSFVVGLAVVKRGGEVVSC